MIDNTFINFTKNINFCNEIKNLVYLKKKRDMLEDRITNESNIEEIDMLERINDLNNIFNKIEEIRLYLSHVSIEYRKKRYTDDMFFEPNSVFYVP